MKKNIKFFALAIFAVFSLFFVTATMAQTSTTGSVEGVISDPNGAVVPNIAVTLSGSNLITPKTATTDEEGRYRFSQVPPGRYTLETAAATGFGASRQTDVIVSLSTTTTVNITVSAAGVGGVVDVVATPEIDQTNNTTGTNVSTEQFSNFPTGRTVQSLYTIAPTVSRSGLRDASGRDRDPSVAGSSGPENNYILDGVNATDPAFGGSGANLPFEFVQEIEIKTGAYGAEYGKSTGGIFNVITKSGTNEFHGDVFAYYTGKNFVRDVKDTAFPFTGAVPIGFSEVDAGFDIGGPIIKDKLWFFGAFNPQRRKNFSLTQTFFQEAENEVTTPFYAGKLTWGINSNHTFTFSTFADFTKQEGFLFGLSGFGAHPESFLGTVETGGSNYAFRLNSTFSPNFTGEFSFGLHYQRANTIPELDESAITNRFSVLRAGAIVTPVETTVLTSAGLRLAYVEGSGGSVQRNFVVDGFGTGGLKSKQDRDRWEWAARLQNIWGDHTFKYGFEYTKNLYRIDTRQTGADFNFGGSAPAAPYRVENRWAICSRTSTSTITCPDNTRRDRVLAIIAAGQAPTGVTTAVTGTVAVNPTNPFLLLDVVRARSFSLFTGDDFTSTVTKSFYVQDDWRVARNLQLNFGVRWDLQNAFSTGGVEYLDESKLDDLWETLQPRIGFIWDFTGKGRGKIFANYARFVETPIPLDVNVRASGSDIQNDHHLNVSRINGTGVEIGYLGNLGNHATPEVAGLKPQSVNEWTAGVEYQLTNDLAVGSRFIYRAQGSVIEDGSYDDGNCYFLFNPGESSIAAIVALLEHDGCLNGPGQPTSADILAGGDIFGRARRFYRGIEFTATKRFSNNYQFIASYVYSSLIGNYEGLFRNDNGQSDPNITSLFDLPTLLAGTYGRLPNDRPHQFKFNGSYRWPFNLTTSASFQAQSGIPYNLLIPHPVYLDNEGFCQNISGIGFVCNPRGTAINPVTGKSRTPFTWNLDLGAYYPWRFSESKELRFTVDWFNVFNNQKAIRQDETFYLTSGAPSVPPSANPFVGTGTIFQFPSHLRIGAKFSF